MCHWPTHFGILCCIVNIFSATIVPCEVLPACLSVGASRFCNASSFCCRVTILVHMWSVIYFAFMACHKVGGSRTCNTSQPLVCGILSICARVLPYLTSLILVYTPSSCSGTRLRSTDGGGGFTKLPSKRGKRVFWGQKNFRGLRGEAHGGGGAQRGARGGGGGWR